jgi:hypothetical protein
MSALMCGRCPEAAMPVRVQGLLTDPPGWSHLGLTGLPMLHRTLCPTCTTAVRALLATPPAVAEAQHDAELAETWRRGYEAGCDDTEKAHVCVCPPAASEAAS